MTKLEHLARLERARLILKLSEMGYLKQEDFMKIQSGFTLEELELLWEAVRSVTPRYRKAAALQSTRQKLGQMLYYARMLSLQKEFQERLG